MNWTKYCMKWAFLFHSNNMHPNTNQVSYTILEEKVTECEGPTRKVIVRTLPVHHKLYSQNDLLF